jgi:hypothetical protein
MTLPCLCAKDIIKTLHRGQKFPYVRKPCSVSYEMQFPDGQADIGQHRPIVCLALTLANFSRFDGLTLIFWEGIF